MLAGVSRPRGAPVAPAGRRRRPRRRPRPGGGRGGPAGRRRVHPPTHDLPRVVCDRRVSHGVEGDSPDLFTRRGRRLDAQIDIGVIELSVVTEHPAGGQEQVEGQVGVGHGSSTLWDGIEREAAV